MNVASIKITSEEDGFHLIIDGDSPCEGYTASILDFNIHSVAVDLLAAVEREIAPWHREGMSVLAEMKAAGAFAVPDWGIPEDHTGDESSRWEEEHGPTFGEPRAFACGPEDVDESGGYDTSDPKHPRYHSTHADLWDAREGK